MDKIIIKYNEDINKYGSYIYTKNNKLSSVISNKRLTEATLAFINFRNQNIIDIGCGDGTYTFQIYKLGKPKSILGIDFSENAIKTAKLKYAKKGKISFLKGNACNLGFIRQKFDIAILRGVLHHLKEPQKAIDEVIKVSKNTIIIEPNGMNPFVKLIEIFSPYHREHYETSSNPHLLKKWVLNSKGIIVKEKFINFVPFFCSDMLALIMKKSEPFIEKSLINQFLCSAYIFMFKSNKLMNN